MPTPHRACGAPVGTARSRRSWSAGPCDQTQCSADKGGPDAVATRRTTTLLITLGTAAALVLQAGPRPRDRGRGRHRRPAPARQSTPVRVPAAVKAETACLDDLIDNGPLTEESPAGTPISSTGLTLHAPGTPDPSGVRGLEVADDFWDGPTFNRSRRPASSAASSSCASGPLDGGLGSLARPACASSTPRTSSSPTSCSPKATPTPPWTWARRHRLLPRPMRG